MNSSIQGIIIALLIAFLVGILVGYSFVQRRFRQQAEALKISQRRLEEMEQSHELRLRETIDQLRQDYEAEIAETIEHYQDQLSQKTVEMEQIYETRFQVLQQGETATNARSLVGAVLTDNADVRSPAAQPQALGTIEPLADEKPQALTQPELLHLKKQYEMRLKEAAQKLQKAYEKQLAEHAKKARADIQTEYEKRLVQKLKEYEEQFAQRRTQLEQEYADRQPPTAQSMLTAGIDIPTPSEIMGTGDDTTVTLPPPNVPGASPQRPPAAQYSQADLEARLQEATEQVRQEYEQQLASQLEEQQEQFDLRLQDLEAEYKQKMETLSASAQKADTAADPLDELFDDSLFDLEETPSNQENSSDDDDDDFGPLDLSDISQLT